MSHVWMLCRRWLRDESGQDLVEYMLLAALIGLAAAASAPAIQAALTAGYVNWNEDTQDLWVPLDPGAGS